MKLSKEVKTGIIVVLAIGLLIAGINFLKGNSFFGGDDVYYVYMQESGGVTPATSVYVNGVVIGKVLNVQLTQEKDSTKRVLMTFNVQDRNFKIPVSAKIHSGSVDLLTKGLLIEPGNNLSEFFEPGDKIQGTVESGMVDQVMEYADPLVGKVTSLAETLDKFVKSFSAFWDTTANSELKQTFDSVQIALSKFTNVATQLENLVASEKVKLSTILSNVESITGNLEKSNAKIENILGNAEKITDDLVTSDFKGTIEAAKNTLTKFNTMLDAATNGEGTLGKLLSDEQLYNELNKTNQRLQHLVEDIEAHPERYIHFSVFGVKTKGVPLTKSDEQKLKQILDSTELQE